MICEKCKKEFPDNLAFCPFCGVAVQDESMHEDTEQKKLEEARKLEEKRRLEEKLRQQEVELEKIKKQQMEEEKRKLQMQKQVELEQARVAGIQEGEKNAEVQAQLEEKRKIDEDNLLIDELLFNLRVEKNKEERIKIFQAFDQNDIGTVEGRKRIANISQALRIPRPTSVLMRKIFGFISLFSLIIGITTIEFELDDVVIAIVTMLYLVSFILYVIYIFVAMISCKKSGYNPKLKRL